MICYLYILPRVLEPRPIPLSYYKIIIVLLFISIQRVKRRSWRKESTSDTEVQMGE